MKDKKNLEIEIEREQSLSISMPEFLTVIRVVSEGSNMVESEEIEKIGMEIAMEYERQNDRKPEDVSKENLGFDIRSRGKDELRYIEVKARASEGEIALTTNEWFKAKRFKNQYWLYIVTDAGKCPVLSIINNPVENLEAQEKMEIVKFFVPLEEWKKKRVEVWKGG